MNVVIIAEKQWQSLIKDKIAVDSNPFPRSMQIIIFQLHSQKIFYSDSMLFIFVIKIRTSTLNMLKTGEWIDVLILIRMNH